MLATSAHRGWIANRWFSWAATSAAYCHSRLLPLATPLTALYMSRPAVNFSHSGHSNQFLQDSCFRPELVPHCCRCWWRPVGRVHRVAQPAVPQHIIQLVQPHVVCTGGAPVGALVGFVGVPQRHAVVPGAQVRIRQLRDDWRKRDVAPPACPDHGIPLAPGLQGAALEGLLSTVVGAVGPRKVLQEAGKAAAASSGGQGKHRQVTAACTQLQCAEVQGGVCKGSQYQRALAAMSPQPASQPANTCT